MRATGFLRLAGPIRDYAWGDRHTIAELVGVEPTGGPMAELWLGAHADDPSTVADSGHSLADVVAADPTVVLGRAVAERFADLPFLVKVLAVAEPLSLQAHPSRDQAEAGFTAEEERGLAPDSDERNYRDRNHKPELLCALSDFSALCGFRPVDETLALLDALAVPELDGHRARLLADDGLRDVVTDLLTRSAQSVATLTDALAPAAARLAEAGGRFAAEAAELDNLGRIYPGDRGIVIAALLNLVRLAPGESVFVAAGQLHAYLKGVGVELLANSDNVLRGGLTGKRVDVAELLRLLDFTPGPVRVDAGTVARHGDSLEVAYASPVPDFQLRRLEVAADPIEVSVPGPRILLCVAGTAEVDVGAVHRLEGGQAGFLTADVDARLRGAPTATVFLATVGNNKGEN
ncbi:MAG: mannose-6-phosphate isomerase, class I [bacterium]